MKRLAIAAASLSLALAGTTAAAQQVKGGETGLKGEIVTGSCSAAPGLSCTILSAPENEALVVTTGCITQVVSGGHLGFVLNGQPLNYTCLGGIAPAPIASLAVGYVVAPGESLDCANPASATFALVCTASGVLTKK
jgi:hypothetical protein